MILIFNTIIEKEAKNNFTDNIAERITFGNQYDVLHLEEEVPDLAEFSHLLLSGSELSASSGSSWDNKIIDVISSFIQQGKPILGICHGHQMIARTLAGNKVCRKAPEPEFGWKRIYIKDNLIFKGISDPVFLESRYDEVFNLPDEFQIIAWNDLAEVQAFQYRDLPVWGVQFHPEVLLQDGSEMVERHLDQNPDDRKYCIDQITSPEKIPQSLNIFRNFYKVT